MITEPIQVEKKVAVDPIKKVKPTYDFWPIRFRSVARPEKVTIYFNTGEVEEFSLKADLVFLQIQGDALPNYFCLEFAAATTASEKDASALRSLQDNFTKLGNTHNMTIETDEFSVVCYRPVCISREQKYANFCFKRSQ